MGDGVDLVVQDPKDGHRRLHWLYAVCPNPECRESTLKIGLFKIEEKDGKYVHVEEANPIIREVKPESSANQYPDYVPKAIRDDYTEACLIRDYSPKASATLSRRCLQGMIRDTFDVKPGNLYSEISQISEKTDPITWKAIDSVREIGNIGAHMQQDISKIIDIDPNEAGILLKLIETLIEEWYVKQEDRKMRCLEVTQLAEKKKK